MGMDVHQLIMHDTCLTLCRCQRMTIISHWKINWLISHSFVAGHFWSFMKSQVDCLLIGKSSDMNANMYQYTYNVKNHDGIVNWWFVKSGCFVLCFVILHSRDNPAHSLRKGQDLQIDSVIVSLWCIVSNEHDICVNRLQTKKMRDSERMEVDVITISFRKINNLQGWHLSVVMWV